MSKLTIPPASQKILDREAELVAQIAELGSEAFDLIKHERLEAVRDGNASPESIKAVAELSKLEKDRHEMREAQYHALQGVREAGFITIRDEVIKLMLAARIARREKLDSDVQDLRKKYPGLDVSFDKSWDSGAIHHLRELVVRNNPISNHTGLSEIIAGYSI